MDLMGECRVQSLLMNVTVAYNCRAYLVRDSTTVPNSFVLTMYTKSVSKNFQILPVRALFLDHPS